MTEEERKLRFGILVEDLYYKLQLIQESTVPDKKERAAKLIHEFYTEHKEEYKIVNIQEIIENLDQVNENMKKIGRATDTKKVYSEEEIEDR